MDNKYTYKMRPSYGGGQMLLEFDIYPDMEKFMYVLVYLLDKSGFSFGNATQVPMNDEVWLELSSSEGKVLLSRDIYNLVFISAIGNSHPDVIPSIDKALKASGLFESTPYDIEEYL